MTQEEKQLLLKDLCTRLPYNVIINCTEEDDEKTNFNCFLASDMIKDIKSERAYWIIKPYLRSMSSMTEEEFGKLKEYSGLKYEQLDLASFQNDTYKCLDFYLSEVPSYVVILVFDWLNSHHFDYRGLIEMGLAIEAPEGMYKTE